LIRRFRNIVGNSSKRDTKRAATAEEANRALELRKHGRTYRGIAQALACSVAYAHKLVDGAIAAIPAENAEQVRKLELARLDRMLAGLWKGATTGDPRAVTAVVMLQNRRAKYLGLDAPEKMELTGKDGGPIQTAQLQQEARKMTDAELEAVTGGAIDLPPDSSSGAGTPEAPESKDALPE
jgi:hypothetical protein